VKYLIEISEISVNERIRLAKKTKDIGLIRVLSEDEESSVKIALGENPSTPLEILDKLSRDPVWNVRIATLKNPNTTQLIKKRLLHDKKLYVRLAAKNAM